MPFDCPAWPPRWPEIDTAIDEAIRSGQWGRYHSTICAALEQRLSDQFQAPVRLCCSGTAALEIAMRALQIGSGDEVIVAAYDYPGNFRTIELLGARPVLVDVSPTSPSIDPDQIEEAASDRVRAVVASHLYGRAAHVTRLREVCDRHDWVLIEDACQVAGMRLQNRPAGAFGDLATLSFGGSKLISAGSGGALIVNSERIAARIGGLVDRPGDTFALAPLAAATIPPQLDRLDAMNQIRTGTVEFLRRTINPRLPTWRWLSTADAQTQAAFYKVAWQAESVHHRQRIIDAAERHQIPIGPGFRTMSRCSEKRCRKPVPTPRAEELSQTVLLLDHAALLVDPARYQELGRCLQQVCLESQL